MSFLQYDQYKTPMENIGLQDSLLSRFDLLFIVLDTVSGAPDQFGSVRLQRPAQGSLVEVVTFYWSGRQHQLSFVCWFHSEGGLDAGRLATLVTLQQLVPLGYS